MYRYLSLEKESDNFCVVFTYSIKQALETRKFHVAVVRRWQTEMYKIARAKLLFNINIYFFAVLLPVAVVVGFVASRNSVTMGNVKSHFSFPGLSIRVSFFICSYIYSLF